MALLQAPPDTHTHSQLSSCCRSPAACSIEIWPTPFITLVTWEEYLATWMPRVWQPKRTEKKKKQLCIGTLYCLGSFNVFHINTHEYIRCLENCLTNQVILGHRCVRTFADSECSFLIHFFKHIFSLRRAMQRDDTLKNILHSFCSFTCWEIQIQALAW